MHTHNKLRFLYFLIISATFVCCNQEEVETTQSQFKPLIIRATIGEPIQPLAGVAPMNALSVNCNLGYNGLNSSVPNNVGQSVLEFNGTAVSNTIIFCNLTYVDWAYNSGMTSVLTDCDPVTVEIVYDGVVVFQETKDLGGAGGSGTVCGDGSAWNVSYTLP
jgi:hypothetical protein